MYTGSERYAPWAAQFNGRRESVMDKRPWWERLFDQDNEAAPIIVLVLLAVAIGVVLSFGPILDRFIEGK